MNHTEINAFRTAHGLVPLVPTPEELQRAKARKQAKNANAAAHAALQRTIRDNHNRNRKA
jgi:hypothetical protein